MKNLKLFFSALTVVFSILVLTKSFSTNILMPLMFISLIMTLLITAKEYYDNKFQYYQSKHPKYHKKRLHLMALKKTTVFF